MKKLILGMVLAVVGIFAFMFKGNTIKKILKDTRKKLDDEILNIKEQNKFDEKNKKDDSDWINRRYGNG